MAIDTSIALGVRPPQFQTIDPMTIYQAMEGQRLNALRERALEQEMQRNALIMQNTMEDRRAAAAKAAAARREQEELIRLFQSGRIEAKNPVMGPGTIQGSTPASFDYEGVKNKLIGAGNVGAFKTVSELQEQEAKRLQAQRAAENESATGAKIRAETEGFNLKNIDTQLAQISSTIDQALTLDDVYAQYRAAPDALAVRGQTPETAIKAFNDRVAQLTQGGLRPDQAFAQAKMEAAKGAMAVQKQLSDEIKIIESPQGQFAYTPRTNQTQRITTPTGEPIMPTDKRSVTNIDMKGESAFTGELGKLEAADVMKGRAAAEDARSIVDTINVGRNLLDKGVISGFGANFKLGFAKAAKELGVSGFDGAIENTEAYASNMAQNVGKLIKQFGAGTGLSDADRQYAEKMAGGSIALDEASMRKILDISERAARNVVTFHNKRVENIKSQTGLSVEQPPTASGLRYFTHPSEVKAANLPSGTRFMTPQGEKVVP